MLLRPNNRSISYQLLLCAFILLIVICFIIMTADAGSPFKAHRKFAKHLYKFVRKEKKFFKKKGLEAAALVALSSVNKKKIPIPFPLPIPIVHQPIIHEPIFFGGKFSEKGLAKGAAIDLLLLAKTGGLGHLGGFGGIGHLGGIGGFGGLGGLGGLGGFGGGGFI